MLLKETGKNSGLDLCYFAEQSAPSILGVKMVALKKDGSCHLTLHHFILADHGLSMSSALSAVNY